jgi:hypothetical protein
MPQSRRGPTTHNRRMFLRDIICISCSRILADHLIDSRREWGPSFDNSSPSTEYSASDYPATPASDYLASNSPDSDYPSSEYADEEKGNEYLGNDGPGNGCQDNDHERDDSPTSVNEGFKTPTPDSPSTPAAVLKHHPDVGTTAPRVVFTIDVKKASFIHEQVRRMHAHLWSLRYLARSFQHRIDHLQKRISEDVTKWQKMTREMNELDYYIAVEGPFHKWYEGRLAQKIALAAIIAIQQEEIRKLEFELESNKDMLDYKEKIGGKIL